MRVFLLTLIGLPVILFLINMFGLFNYQFFAPKYEAVRREVYENTQSYTQGSIRDFDNLYLAYTQAKTDEEKAIILDTLRHRTAGVRPENIPPRIRTLLGQ